MKPTLSALFSGTLFGAGLATSQMTNPAKVIRFLDVAGSWDPKQVVLFVGSMLAGMFLFKRVGEPRAVVAPGQAASQHAA